MADADVPALDPKRCPRCRKDTVVPIVYGFPTSSTWEKAERGEVVLGGCMVSADDPVAECTTCGWRRKRKTPRWAGEPPLHLS